MFDNIIFDWSGTLVDDLGPVIEATNAVLSRYGIAALDREGFRRKFRLPYREFYAEMLPAARPAWCWWGRPLGSPPPPLRQAGGPLIAPQEPIPCRPCDTRADADSCRR